MPKTSNLLLLFCLTGVALAWAPTPKDGRSGLSHGEIRTLQGLRHSALDLAQKRGIFCTRVTMHVPLHMTRKDVEGGFLYEWISRVDTARYGGSESYSQDPGACFVSGYYRFTFQETFENGGRSKISRVTVEPTRT